MNRSSPSVVRLLLQDLGVRPRKRWGQHFLCDGNVLRRIVEAAELAPGERVLEIGPGLGALSQALLDAGARVTAVEIDPILCRSLRDLTGLEVIEGDFLRVEIEMGEPVKVVANLPYYVTTPILEKLFAWHSGWRLAVLTMQTEVAQRLAARAGTPEYGSLSVFAQYHAVVERLFSISASCFYPPPEVGSTVVRLRPREPVLTPEQEATLERLVRAGFGGRRKTLRNSLRSVAPENAGEALAACGIDPARRAETLSLDEFLALARALTS